MGSTICRFLICVGVGGNAKGFKIWAGWRRLRWRWQWVMVRSCCSFFYWFDIYGEEEVGWTTVSQWIIVTTRLSLYFVHNKEWALPCPATCYMYLRRQNSVTLEICLGLLVCTLCYYCCQTHLPTSTSFHCVTDRIKKLFHLVFGRQIYLLYWLWFSWRIFRLSLPSRMGMSMPGHLAIYFCWVAWVFTKSIPWVGLLLFAIISKCQASILYHPPLSPLPSLVGPFLTFPETWFGGRWLHCALGPCAPMMALAGLSSLQHRFLIRSA